MKKFLFTLCMAVFCASAHAELKSVDFIAKDDRLITYDSDTGLYWLSLAFTNSTSDFSIARTYTYSIVERRTQTIGDLLYGFRHATLKEVGDLYRHAGLRTDLGPNYQLGANATPNQTKWFLSMMGVTYKSESSISYEYQQFGFTSTKCNEITDSNCPISFTTGNYRVMSKAAIRSVDQTAVTLIVKGVSDDSVIVNSGHYLTTYVNPSKLF